MYTSRQFKAKNKTTSHTHTKFHFFFFVLAMGVLFSKRTLIANGYHQDIYARVESDKSSAVKSGATHLRLPASSSSSASERNHRGAVESQKGEEEDKFTTNELFKEKLFTKIGPGFRACFRTARNANSVVDGEASSSSSVVYISIALANGDFICRGLQVTSGCIISVDGAGNLKTGQQQHSIGTTKSSVAWKDFVVDVVDDKKIKKNI